MSELLSALRHRLGKDRRKPAYDLSHLSPTQRKQVRRILRQAEPESGHPQTAQQSLPYLRMMPNGICQLSEKRFSKTIQYFDINYQLAANEDKTAIFQDWSDFLNFFDASITVQLSFINREAGRDSNAQTIQIPLQQDGYDEVRREYAAMLRLQLSKGNNGFVKSKYITLTISADGLRSARQRLERIELEVLNNFKVLGAVAQPLDGFARLQMLHDILRPGADKFRFDWNWLHQSGLRTQDFIAPNSFTFDEARLFQMGSIYGNAEFLQILASELNDRILSGILKLEHSLIATLHIQSIDQARSLRRLSGPSQIWIG